MCVLVMYHKPSSNVTKLRGKMCFLICCPVTRLMVKDFFLGLSVGMNNGSITLNHRQRDSQWNGVIEVLLGRRGFMLPLQQENSWTLFFGMQKGWFWYTLCNLSNHYFRSVHSDTQGSSTSQKYCWNPPSTRQCTTTRKSEKHMKQLKTMDWLFVPTHHTAQILLSQICACLKPLKKPSEGKGLGLMTRLLKKGINVCEYKIQTRRGWQTFVFLSVARLFYYEYVRINM